MSNAEKMTLDEFHKKIAIQTNNSVWPTLDKDSPSQDELDQALHMAHTSHYHWSKIGEPINIARAEYMIARVYSAMGEGSRAAHHAELCLKITEKTGIGDFDLAFAYEVLAKAHAANGDSESCKKYKQLAQKATDAVKDDQDKKICQGEVDKIDCS